MTPVMFIRRLNGTNPLLNRRFTTPPTGTRFPFSFSSWREWRRREACDGTGHNECWRAQFINGTQGGHWLVLAFPSAKRFRFVFRFRFFPFHSVLSIYRIQPPKKVIGTGWGWGGEKEEKEGNPMESVPITSRVDAGIGNFRPHLPLCKLEMEGGGRGYRRNGKLIKI